MLKCLANCIVAGHELAMLLGTHHCLHTILFSYVMIIFIKLIISKDEMKINIYLNFHFILNVYLDAEDEDSSDTSGPKLRPRLSSAKVVHAKYPFFVPPNKKDEMAPDALNDVVTFETDVELVMKTPFFDLQVPAQSRLLGYNNHEIHLGYDYVEPVLARTLRAGAKVCIIVIC